MQCYIPNIKALGRAASEEMSFEAIVQAGFPLHFGIGGTFGLIPYFCTLNV